LLCPETRDGGRRGREARNQGPGAKRKKDGLFLYLRKEERLPGRRRGNKPGGTEEESKPFERV